METSRPATWVRTPKVPFRQRVEMWSEAISRGQQNVRRRRYPRS